MLKISERREQKKVLKKGNARECLNFAYEYAQKGANIQALQKVVIKSGDAELCYLFAKKVKGADILRNTSSYPYYAPNPITINSDEYYTVACIDYVLFHKDSNRNYDKFPSFNGEYSYVEERVSSTLIEDYFAINPIISFEDLSSQPGFNNISR